jgi:hypothetical protein
VGKDAGAREETLSGPVPELAEQLLDWIERNGLGARQAPPEGFGLPQGDSACSSYCNGIEAVLEDVLSRTFKQGLRHIDQEGRDIFERLRSTYFEGQRRYLTTMAPVALMGVTSAIQAPVGGWLSAARRELILRDTLDPGAPPYLARLAPAILGRLGRVEEAAARREALLQGGGGGGPYRGERGDPYRAWLLGLPGG